MASDPGSSRSLPLAAVASSPLLKWKSLDNMLTIPHSCPIWILQMLFVYLTNAPGVTLPQTDSKSFVYTEDFESVAYTLTTRMHLELVLNDRVWQLYIS